MSRLAVVRAVLSTPCKLRSLRVATCGRPQSTAAPAKILESPFGTVEVPNLTITDFIWSHGQQWAGKRAVTCGLTDRHYTYGDCQELSQRFAWALTKDLGLNKGEVIGLLLPNIPEYALAIHGGISAGLMVTFANPLYTAHEVSRQFQNAGVKCCITVPQLSLLAEEVSSTLKDYHSTIIVGQEAHNSTDKTLSFEQLLKEAQPTELPKLSPDDVALLPYSSGTTGMPKGVKLTHRNLVSNIEMMKHPDIIDHIPTSDTYQEVALSVLPFFHIYGFNGILNCNMAYGFNIVSIPKFTPEDYIDCIIKYKPTILFVVPSLLLFLASHPAVTREHLSSIKGVVSGAAPATTSLLDKFRTKIGRDNVNIRQGYGMTETAPVTLFTRRNMPKGKTSSCGQVVPLTEARLVDSETGEPLGPHQSGELLVRGPQVMSGYLNNDEATRETIDADGWLHTGDVMYYDEDEYFFIVDRTKELIKVKGNQVSPTELENIIMELPGVADTAVVGIPDTLAGEIPRAFVVRRQNAQVTEQDVIDHVEPKVVRYKRLAGGVRFLDTIPRNPSGKVLRQQLKVLGENTPNP